MKICIAKETAPLEERVIIRPQEVLELTRSGHEVIVEKSAGIGVNFTDQDYEGAGARVVEDRLALYRDAELLVKLKAPSADEFGMLGKNILLSMLHYQQNPVYLYHLGKNDVIAIALELIKNLAGERMIDATDITAEAGVLYATRHLKKIVSETNVLILGYGRVGSGAISICNKLGMNVKILRKEEYRHIKRFLTGKDILINTIAWPVAEKKGQYLIRRDMLKLMNMGAIVLDLSVDFPSPIETCKPTTLSNPWYVEEGVIHIGIYGYPGLVPVSCTERYSRQILPIVKMVADNHGVKGLSTRSSLGKFIAKAVVIPGKRGWEKYAPQDISQQSLIE